MTNDSGMVVTSHEYLPFGEDWITEGDTKNAPKYNSQELDKESGYYFYNARHYDPEIARFVTPDTVIDGENSVIGWNRYAYCHNNPIIYKDPSGHESYVVARDMKGIPAGVHSYNVAVSKNPAKDWGQYYKDNKDKFSTYTLSKDALGYKKGDVITYRIMAGSAKGPVGEKMVKAKWDHDEKSARSTARDDRDSFLQYLRTDDENKALNKLREEKGFRTTDWHSKAYELNKNGKTSGKLDVDIMKAFDSYNEKATYRVHGQGGDSGNCHTLTNSISVRGGATNYKDVEGISPGNKVMPDKFFK